MEIKNYNVQGFSFLDLTLFITVIIKNIIKKCYSNQKYVVKIQRRNKIF